MSVKSVINEILKKRQSKVPVLEATLLNLNGVEDALQTLVNCAGGVVMPLKTLQQLLYK